MSDFIYLDNAATTFPKPEAVYAVQDRINRTMAVNAGRGAYQVSREASALIAECRTQMAALTGCAEENLIFAPSATIGLNQIILGLAWDPYKVVYVSPYEHNAVMRPLYRICQHYGIELRILATSVDGSLDLERIAIQFAKKSPNYVFLTHISNVTGYILPIREVADFAHQYGAKIIADCSQSIGLLDASLDCLHVDYLAFAGHKTLYGSFGIGGWAAKDSGILESVICGGTGSDSLNQSMPSNSPGKFEAGSPNILAIGALNAALSWRKTLSIGEMENRERQLTDLLVSGLAANKQIHVYRTSDSKNHLSVVSFNHKSYMADELGTILDQDYSIAVRVGFHCAPLVHDLISSVPKRGTVRASIGYFTTEQDINHLLEALEELD